VDGCIKLTNDQTNKEVILVFYMAGDPAK